MTAASAARTQRNRDAIAAELDVLRAYLRGDAEEGGMLADLERSREVLDTPSTLDEIVEAFGLTGFERSVLLLAAGWELSGAVADDLGGRPVSFGLALERLPDAHWSAVTPPAPLRYWHLLSVHDPASPIRSALSVDERILHHIAGTSHMDAAVAAVAQPVPPAPWLPPSLAQAADRVVRAWRADRPIHLHGPQRGNVLAVFAGAVRAIGLTGYVVGAADLPREALAREVVLRRLERETVLAGCAWLIEGGEVDADVVCGLHGPIAVLQDSPALGDGVDVRVDRLEVAERRDMFASALRRAGAAQPAELTDRVAGSFDVAVPEVEEITRDVLEGADLWQACRARTRCALGSLATVIKPVASWADLVLPEVQLRQLRALAATVRHRSTVLDDWGFDRMRGLGATALFAGPSGTGKTLAAEVLAGDLGLDLLHVDLSQVVSKYIGETEKHLKRLFDAAESGGCVLLFDEADVLFGKRTEVRDSHDRYANIEVAYLLQRMESFRGLAILTTNAKSALDQAFLRRLRSVITFPYPDPALRRRIWDVVFPAAVPVDGLDSVRLAAIDVPGGGIASIALTAAYLAADEGTAVADRHVSTAARWELAKSGRSGGSR